MQACTFFGHSSGCGASQDEILSAIKEAVLQGVRVFYVGNHGEFDRRVQACLDKLCKERKGIEYFVVLAYLPESAQEIEGLHNTIYPEIESGPPRFAISRRNRWMIQKSDYCICYVTHKWGGAYQFATLAAKQGLKIINLATDVGYTNENVISHLDN